MGKEPSKGRENILESKGYDYPLEKLDAFLDGYVIANYEGVISDLDLDPPYIKQYMHKDKAVAVQALERHGFDALSIENNHIYDFGPEGRQDTVANLAGFDLITYHEPLSINGTRIFAVYYQPDISSDPFLCKELRDSKKADIVFPHWGDNYANRTTQQKMLAEYLISCGADMIIGHGGHALQEIEQIKGKPVLYSIGNFMFNSPGRYKSTRSLPYSLVVEVTPGRLKIYPIFTDNLKDGYQGYPVTEEQFAEVSGYYNHKFETGRDSKGLYLVVKA